MNLPVSADMFQDYVDSFRSFSPKIYTTLMNEYRHALTLSNFSRTSSHQRQKSMEKYIYDVYYINLKHDHKKNTSMYCNIAAPFLLEGDPSQATTAYRSRRTMPKKIKRRSTLSYRHKKGTRPGRNHRKTCDESRSWRIWCRFH